MLLHSFKFWLMSKQTFILYYT